MFNDQLFRKEPKTNRFVAFAGLHCINICQGWPQATTEPREMYISNSWEQVWAISCTPRRFSPALWRSEPAPHSTLPSPSPASNPALLAQESQYLYHISQSVCSWGTACAGLWGWPQLDMWEVDCPRDDTFFFLRL